jgi:hypothetical protein
MANPQTLWVLCCCGPGAGGGGPPAGWGKCPSKSQHVCGTIAHSIQRFGFGVRYICQHSRKPPALHIYSITMASETTPLVSRKGDEDIDLMPNGAEAEEFNPRPVLGRRNGTPPPASRGELHNRHKMKQPSFGGGFIDFVIDSLKPSFALSPPLGPPGGDSPPGGIGTLLIPRKAPVKVEPKVHFANERTFMAWLSIITILTSASGLITKYGDDGDIATQLYGLVLLPVSVAFLFYTLWKCKSSLCCRWSCRFCRLVY